MKDELDVPVTIEVDELEPLTAEAMIKQIVVAVRATAAHCGYRTGSVGILVTDDETIHVINREHLQHDYPTDVISFAYQQAKPLVQGELVASWDTARRCASEAKHAALSELLLYIVHGTLHICGLDDQSPPDRQQMRQAEQTILRSLGITQLAPVDHDPDA